MHRRWLSRALIALAVPALTVPLLASSATAAGAAGVPTINAVAKTYPHLEGGSASVSASKVYGPGKKCKAGKPIKGASARFASYSPDYSSGDPDVYAMTGAHPGLTVTAMRFPSAKAAIKYLHGYATATKHCPGGNPGGGGSGGGRPDCDTKMKKIRFALGDERWGYQMRSSCRASGQTTSSVLNMLFARDGRFVVYANAMSLDASAPSVPKSIKLTAVALKAV